MSRPFPETPVSLLARMAARGEEQGWHDDWREFWNLYHLPLRNTVMAQFHRYGWECVSETLLEEVLADVVLSFFKSSFSNQRELGRLRHYLSRLAQRRVQDHLRRSSKEESRQREVEAEMAVWVQEEPANAEEEVSYRQALLATLLEDVRSRVNPQTFLFFEMVKLQGRNAVEIAAAFGVSRNVVDNAVARVIKQLRALAALPEYKGIEP